MYDKELFKKAEEALQKKSNDLATSSSAGTQPPMGETTGGDSGSMLSPSSMSGIGSGPTSPLAGMAGMGVGNSPLGGMNMPSALPASPMGSMPLGTMAGMPNPVGSVSGGLAGGMSAMEMPKMASILGHMAGVAAARISNKR